ncbi:MAG TPA: carbamoyltransferase HypF, partial [Thermoanaerobaculia bacterium]|nr:carbamoyltransferase HypF [Thermoanaerobaculia bacterium]
VGHAAAFTRLGRLRPFRLPGGEAAVREPRRVAFALLTDLGGAEAVAASELPPLAELSAAERNLLARLVATGLHAPWTSSLGRLFDGVAALCGLAGKVSFEGEAAIALEHLADRDERGAYPLPLVPAPAPAPVAPGQLPRAELLELDWRPLLAALLADLARGRPGATIAARFHNAMADAALALAQAADRELVVLTGGCFQNRLLAERVAERVRGAGFTPLLHRQVPANDGGIALGQVAVAAARLAAATTGDPPDVPGSSR